MQLAAWLPPVVKPEGKIHKDDRIRCVKPFHYFIPGTETVNDPNGAR
jgi:hypothetical protein